MKIGDFNTTDIEKKLNITLSDTDRDKLEGMRQSKANDIIPGNGIVSICHSKFYAVIKVLLPWSMISLCHTKL